MRIGVDLGGTKIEGVLIDESGLVLETRRVLTPRSGVYADVLRAIENLVSVLQAASDTACRIGVGSPGALSSTTGKLKNSNTVCLNGQPLKQDLEKILGREIKLENDANCFALSEATDGAGRDYGVVFGVIMGTGVGGGIVFNKQLHRGPQHIAGEWGHNTLIENGASCYCGRKGCVETCLSGPGLARLWIEQGNHGKTLAAKEIVTRARQGDPGAVTVMQTYLRLFGRALANIINILDPDAIVLGGGMSNIRELYTTGAEQVSHYVFNDKMTTPILKNCHGDSSGVRGAAHLWP